MPVNSSTYCMFRSPSRIETAVFFPIVSIFSNAPRVIFLYLLKSGYFLRSCNSFLLFVSPCSNMSGHTSSSLFLYCYERLFFLCIHMIFQSQHLCQHLCVSPVVAPFRSEYISKPS